MRKRLFLVLSAVLSMAAFAPSAWAQAGTGVGKTTGEWVVGQIEVGGQQQPYCSMKNGFNNGFVLVIARDALGSNSMAVEFKDDILSQGQPYTADIMVEPNLHRQLEATAVTPRVLVMQIGKDSVFFEALRRRDRMDFFVPATAQASFSLRGTARAFDDLINCTSLLPGAEMAMPEEKIYKSVEDTSARIDQQKMISTDQNSDLLNELAAARAEISRLKTQQATALSALGAADAPSPAPAAVVPVESSTPTPAPSSASNVAEQITWETAPAVTATPSAPSAPSAAPAAAQPAREAAIAQVEASRPAVVDNVATMEQPSIRSTSRIEEALGATEQEQRRDVESVLLDQPTQSQPAPPAVVGADAAPEMTPPATPAPQPQMQQAQLPPVVPQEAPVVASLPPANIQQPVAPMAQPEAPASSGIRAPGQLAPAEISELLRTASIPVDSEIQADFPSTSEHAAYSWKTQELFGGINQASWTGSQSFTDMVNQYISVTKSRCPGDFASDLEPVQQNGAYTMVLGEIACIDDVESAAAALLFYGKPGGQFTVISHEGTTEQMTDAILARDSLANTLRSRVN